MPEFTGSPRGQGRRCAVLVSRFNEMITQRLLDGALDALVKHGVAFDDVDVFWVRGSYRRLPGTPQPPNGTKRSSRSARSFAATRRTSTSSPARHRAVWRLSARTSTCQ
jgi:hypothetical protein